MNHCLRCQAALKPENQFCPACGTRQESLRPTRLGVGITGNILLLIITLLLLTLWNLKS